MSSAERLLVDTRDALRFPSAETLTIGPDRIHNADAPVARFGDDEWPMLALTNDASRRYSALRFEAWPDGFREFAKHVAYVLINYGNPESLVEKTNGSYVPWPSPGSISTLFTRLRPVVTWLAGPWSTEHATTPVTTPGDLDSDHLAVARRWIEAVSSTGNRDERLEAVVRVWHLNPWLPDDMQWPEPLWRAERWRGARRRGENATKRLSQATAGPLLEWSVAFVTQFADDIFAATEHYAQRQAAAEAHWNRVAARGVARQYAEQDLPLPAGHSADGRVLDAPSWRAMAYRHNIAARPLKEAFQEVFRPLPRLSGDLAAVGIDYAPTARFHGRPWIPGFSVQDVESRNHYGVEIGSRLLAHLRTACLVVAAYLTGARAEEVVNWQSGAALDPILTPSGGHLHLIHGQVWKGAYADAEGVPPTAREANWATIAIGADAIRVAERINRALGLPEGPLFAFDGSRVGNTTVKYWIANLITFVNVRLAPSCTDPAALLIPADPDGPVSLSRLRRTLAWFIRNRPNGDVTTAIQYQHLSTTIGAGYAGTKEGGLADLLLEEDWAHRRRTIEHLQELLDTGQTLHGAAATRAVSAARRLPRHLTPADERRLRRDRSLLVYENRAAIALCVYDEPRALCRKIEAAGRSEPNLLDCADRCLNLVRTDEHLQTLRTQALALRAQAELAPAPMARSLQARAERNERIIADAQAQPPAQPEQPS